MDVVAHQHAGVDRDLTGRRNLCQQLQIVRTIHVIDKHCSAIDPALGDMEGNSRQLETGAT